MEQSEFERARYLAGRVKQQLPPGSDIRLCTRRDDPYMIVHSPHSKYEGKFSIEQFLSTWDMPIEEMVRDLNVDPLVKIIMEMRLNEG